MIDRSLQVLLGVSLAAIAGCAARSAGNDEAGSAPGPVTAGSPACGQPDVTERWQDAPAAGDRIEGCFEAGGGADTYRLVIPGEGTMRVTLSIAGAGGVSTLARLLDGNGKRLTGGAAMVALGQQGALDLIAEGGAALHLQLAGNIDPRQPTAFVVDVSAAPAGDPGERNDDPGSATALTGGAPLEAILLPRVDRDGLAVADVDHYRVEVAAASTLSVRIDEVAGTLSPKLDLLDATGGGVASTRPPGLGTPVTLEAAVEPGAYVVRVKHGHTVGPVTAGEHQAGEPPALGAPYRIVAELR